MREKDFAIICQGIAIGLALSIVLGKSPNFAIGIVLLVLCSSLITILRLR